MNSREIQLKRRPVGSPVAEDFALVETAVPPAAPGEVQVRNLFMAVDPAMRGRMSDAKSYVPPFALDAAMEGPAIGEVLVSNDPGFAAEMAVIVDHGMRAKPVCCRPRPISALPDRRG